MVQREEKGVHYSAALDSIILRYTLSLNVIDFCSVVIGHFDDA
jgi:hypothetical protein